MSDQPERRRKKPSIVRSVRCPEDSWARADARAQQEGETMNSVINEFIDGYGRGLLDLPTITKHYTPFKDPNLLT